MQNPFYPINTVSKMPEPPSTSHLQSYLITYSRSIRRELPLSWCYILMWKYLHYNYSPGSLLLNLNTMGVIYLVPFPIGQITGENGHGESWPSPIVIWDLGTCRAYSSAFFTGLMCIHPTRKPVAFHCLTEGKCCLILEDRRAIAVKYSNHILQ